MNKPKSIDRLVDSFSKLPSVGTKSAERFAFAVLDMGGDDVKEFSDALISLKNSVKPCPICGAYSEDGICPICSNSERDNKMLLIVSNPKDILSLEKSEGYKGLYHVLNGEIALSKGKTIEQEDINKLLDRIKQNSFEEIIIATNPTLDGETTALYIAKLLEPLNIKVTRLAYGLQMGGNLDYTDQITLFRALEGRHKI